MASKLEDDVWCVGFGLQSGKRYVKEIPGSGPAGVRAKLVVQDCPRRLRRALRQFLSALSPGLAPRSPYRRSAAR